MSVPNYTFNRNNLQNNSVFQAPRYGCVTKKDLLISQPKHMLWVLTETVLLSTHNTCFKLMDKKIITILR